MPLHSCSWRAICWVYQANCLKNILHHIEHQIQGEQNVLMQVDDIPTNSKMIVTMAKKELEQAK